MRSRAILLALALSARAASGHAQEPASDLYQMDFEELLQIKVVTATRRSQSLAEVPATVYVVNREEIATYGYRDLADVLKHVPGIEIADPHFFLFGGQRGFSNNFSQTLLMINGREMQNLLAGEAFISNQFRTHNVERVEIVMGPASALYGANAFVGVINLITRLQTDWRGTELGFMSGAFDTSSGDFTHAATFGETGRIAASAAIYTSDGEDFSAFINTPALYARGDPAITSGQRRLPRDNPLFPFENPASAAVGSLYFGFGRLYGGAEYYDNQSAGGIESAAFVSPTREDRRRLFSNFLGLKNDEAQPVAWSFDSISNTPRRTSKAVFPATTTPTIRPPARCSSAPSSRRAPNAGALPRRQATAGHRTAI